MKILYKASEKLSFELEGSGQKEIFKELSTLQEIFSENSCGMCKSENLKYVVRNVEDNDYYEIRCTDCGATLSFGQHKKGGTLFPKRKDSDGNWIKNNGWYKYQSNK